MSTGNWLEAHVSTAPETLRQRITALAHPVEARLDTAQALAGIASDTLAAVINGSGDRSAALDLLSADALITLALLAQAERDPARLGQFSVQLLSSGAASA